MQVNIQSKDFALTDALRSYVERRLRFALTRYEPALRKLQVHLSDVNGPRGGRDKCCRVRVALVAQPDVAVEDTENDMYHAVDRAVERAGRAVSRRLDRNRRLSRGNVGANAPAVASDL